MARVRPWAPAVPRRRWANRRSRIVSRRSTSGSATTVPTTSNPSADRSLSGRALPTTGVSLSARKAWGASADARNDCRPEEAALGLELTGKTTPAPVEATFAERETTRLIQETGVGMHEVVCS